MASGTSSTTTRCSADSTNAPTPSPGPLPSAESVSHVPGHSVSYVPGCSHCAHIGQFRYNDNFADDGSCAYCATVGLITCQSAPPSTVWTSATASSALAMAQPCEGSTKENCPSQLTVLICCQVTPPSAVRHISDPGANRGLCQRIPSSCSSHSYLPMTSAVQMCSR